MSAPRRYDPEFALAEVIKQYLDAKLSETLRMASPVVTFYDPMAQDDAHRVVVLIHGAETNVNSPTSWKCQVEVTVKSQTAQKTLQKDMKAHFDRTNEVRDALLVQGMADELDTIDPGLGVPFGSPSRTLSTDVRDGWVYSEIRFDVQAYARQTA